MTWIRNIVDPDSRQWEQMYRNRWEHDAVVRSTHGVNCTGGCSWMVFVKEGIVTWEMQATDYPALEEGLPPYEPRGCQRGITFSWYLYSPLRVKHPYVRGVLLDLWREARSRHPDPVAAWGWIVDDADRRRSYQQMRGKGGLRRSTWQECLELVAASMLHTAKTYGPDRVVGFSPIPAMSMMSYAGGSRLLQLFGATLLSFYDLYGDFPPASPETWGEKTDSSESADWFNSKYIVTIGSNLSMTRTPDVHFAAEARGHGAKLVVLSPDFSQVSRYADWWIPVHAGMDGAFWLAVSHVILREFYVERQVPQFVDYMKRFTDGPFLVELVDNEGVCEPGRLVRADRLARYGAQQHGNWKLVVFDAVSAQPRMPLGSIGFRWQTDTGRWNLEMKDGVDGEPIDPALTLVDTREATAHVRFPDPAGTGWIVRSIPARYLDTLQGRILVTTVFDLLVAEFGVARTGKGATEPETGYPTNYDDENAPFTPAWQERFTGIGRDTVVRFAREWAGTAERTGGKCTIIVGSGVNHWYHANLHYRAAITSLLLCGCVGVNGGGLNHYTGQEKLAPMASWSTIAMARDWLGAARLQNGPSFHYVHSDQWRYEQACSDVHPEHGPFAFEHTLDHQVNAVRRGWLPFYPQFDRNPLELAREAKREGAQSDAQVVTWVVDQLRKRSLSFSVEDPDAPHNWPRVWLIWRANALLASAKGHEYFLRHYLGPDSSAVAKECASSTVTQAAWREAAPTGKLDLVVDINFRMDTSALFADVVLPAASWYEKNDLNTTDLHSYIHPLGKAVPPCWESRSDWDAFRALARVLSDLAPTHFPRAFQDIVTTPLQHDTVDEIAQEHVLDWFRDECEPVPGSTMPHVRVVERDYTRLYDQFCSLGPRVRQQGVEDRGVHMPVSDLYDQLVAGAKTYSWNNAVYPSLEDDVDAANIVLRLAPETNGEVSWRGFRSLEAIVGRPLADLADRQRAVSYTMLDVARQPRRILTSPCWSGITNDGRAYCAFAINVERLVPWRTLSGRQSLYLDHPAYRAFHEHLPTFKGPVLDKGPGEAEGPQPSVRLAYLTPHGKWHMHTTYYDNLRMLTLSRGVEPLWLSQADADAIGVQDNDWVEAINENGVVVTRAVVSARIPGGVCFLYHAPERTIDFPKVAHRGGRRAGGHNSLTRMRLKPVLMVGGYAQHSYRFNDYGPPASDRDTYVSVRKLRGKPQF